MPEEATRQYQQMWVRTWARRQMEASGSSPLRISDQVDRTMRIVAGGVVGPVANNDHNQGSSAAVGGVNRSSCGLGRQPGQQHRIHGCAGMSCVNGGSLLVVKVEREAAAVVVMARSFDAGCLT